MSSTLNDKLSLLIAAKNKLTKFNNLHIFDFEYFQFIFPRIRNKAAHGVLNSTECLSLSKFLLLDFYSIIDFFISPDLRINVKLKTIKNAFFDHNIINLIKLGEFIEEDVDPFYNEEKKMFDDLKVILTNKFSFNKFMEI